MLGLKPLESFSRVSDTMLAYRYLTWSRAVTLLLAAYWIALATATHVPTLPAGSLRYGDKNAHYAAYAVLAFLISWAWRTRREFFPVGMMVTFVVASAYGAVEELTQIPIPGRFAEWHDWLADVMGAITGIILFWAIDALRRLAMRPGK